MSASYKRGLALSRSKGFTLIELLVVIAIIGLLAAVVLASVGTARNKGVDAAVKSNLDNARAAAELYASNNSNSYANVCSVGSSASPAGIATIVGGAATTTGSTVTAYSNGTTGSTAIETAPSGSTPAGTVCADGASYWVAQAPLSASTGTYWCVDNTGNSKGESALLAANSKSCL
jgi:prepilin-type N-terminal cleavage/methylation domain-containing protein